MKSFAFAIVAIIAISVTASYVLEIYQHTVDSSFVGSGARPDPEPKLIDKKAAPKS